MNVNVTQILRPIRLSFLINPNNRKSYLKAIRICSSLWGGIYFPIFPIYRKFTREFREDYRLFEKPIEFYTKSIDNFDPDFIILDKNLESDFINNIKGDRNTIPINELEESLSSGESKYGISIEDILIYLKESEFKYERTDSLQIALPKVGEYDMFTATIFGSVSKQNFKKLKEISFPSKYLTFPEIDQANHSSFSNKALDFLKLSQIKTYPIGNPFWTSQTAVFLLNPDRLSDLIVFWNLRALGWRLIAIPVNLYKEDYYKQQIETQQQEFDEIGSLTNHISILFSSVLEEKLVNGIQKYLNSIQSIKGKTISYTLQWWIPRFWNDRKYLNYDKSASVLIRSSVEKYTLNLNEKISIPVLSPEFGRKYIRHIAPRFVNEIIYEFDDIEAKYAQVIPAIPSKELDFVIKGSGYNQWRFSENGMFFLSKNNDEYLNFSIPKSKDVFEKLFKEKGYEIKSSSVGRLSNQLFRNVGGIYGTNFFATPGILPILSLFENGKIVKKKQLFAELSKQRNHFRLPQLNDVVARLIDKNIIKFGVELQCPFCNQHSFYPLGEFKEVVKCTVCHNQFHPPTHNPDNIAWAYRGIGTFSRNNKSEGIVSLLLTLRFFRIAMHTQSITSTFNFEIFKDDKVINEVDFSVFFKKFKSGFSTPDLFFCECKTEIDFKKKDVDRMENLARLFPNSILVFATLKKLLSDSEKKLISSLAKKFRKGYGSRPVNPILILTGNELLSWLMYDEKIKHLVVPHMQASDEFGHLCDITTQHYLGLPSFSSEVEKRINEREKKRRKRKIK